MELGVIVFLRRVYSGPMLIPILMQMGTVPNLTPISVVVRKCFIKHMCFIVLCFHIHAFFSKNC